MELDYFKILVTITLAVIGWISGHYFTNRRAIHSKRRELVTEHLVNAYRVLAHDVSHREITKERREKLENILSDVQLFGSNGQVDLARSLADDAAQNSVFELDPLINSLRNDLRSELGLETIKGNVRWLRYTGE